MVKDTYEFIIEKYNIDVGKRYVVDIPNINREDLAKLFGELGYQVGAEIGVHKGSYSELLCQVNPNLHLYSIDPWSTNAYTEIVHGIDEDQKKFEGYYQTAKENLAKYNCDIVRKDSLTAAKYFPDDSLDFVYIDANHEFMNVAQDIYTWSKKVRPGGIVSGHDYAYFPKRKHNHVKYVVEAYTRAQGIVPHFVAGADATDIPGYKRDKIRSWFWVKR